MIFNSDLCVENSFLANPICENAIRKGMEGRRFNWVSTENRETSINEIRSEKIWLGSACMVEKTFFDCRVHHFMPTRRPESEEFLHAKNIEFLHFFFKEDLESLILVIVFIVLYRWRTQEHVICENAYFFLFLLFFLCLHQNRSYS